MDHLTMETPIDHASELSVRSQVHSLALVLWMSVVAGALRFSIWAANEITLWYLYGWATVKHDHLRIVRFKPELVVSNGDVLKGIGFYHYLVGVGIWLPLGAGLLALIFYKLVPREMHPILMERPQSAQPSGGAVVVVLALFFLIPGFLPLPAAMALAFASAVVSLLWMRTVFNNRSLLR